MQIDDNALAVAAASTRAGTFSALTMGEHRDICRAAITAYLQALAPPQMVKLSPEDERLLEKALSASRTAVYEIVPASLSPGSTGETEGWVLVPKEPTLGCLISMAIRSNHAFLMPPQKIGDLTIGGTPPEHREGILRSMAQLYEEATGSGFWSPERDAGYVASFDRAMLSAAGERV